MIGSDDGTTVAGAGTATVGSTPATKTTPGDVGEGVGGLY